MVCQILNRWDFNFIIHTSKTTLSFTQPNGFYALPPCMSFENIPHATDSIFHFTVGVMLHKSIKGIMRTRSGSYRGNISALCSPESRKSQIVLERLERTHRDAAPPALGSALAAYHFARRHLRIQARSARLLAASSRMPPPSCVWWGHFPHVRI